MNVRLTRRASREYDSLSPSLQRRATKQFSYLAENLRHPSLNAKKYDEARDIWQGRLTRDYRFLLHHCRGHVHGAVHYQASEVAQAAGGLRGIGDFARKMIQKPQSEASSRMSPQSLRS